MTEVERLRMASADDVERSLVDASFGAWPQDEAGLLEFFNRMIDVILGEEAGDAIMWPNLRRETPN